jgi:cell division protein FtsW
VVRLITKSPKTFGAMVALGISLLLVFQAYFNIAVCLDLVPTTGLPLPLVSMGGTSTLFTCIAFGIILSVSKYIESTSAE